MSKCDCEKRGKWARPEGFRRGPATMAVLHLHFRKLMMTADKLELHVNDKEEKEFFNIGTYLRRSKNLDFLSLPVILSRPKEQLCHWFLKKRGKKNFGVI